MNAVAHGGWRARWWWSTVGAQGRGGEFVLGCEKGGQQWWWAAEAVEQCGGAKDGEQQWWWWCTRCSLVIL